MIWDNHADRDLSRNIIMVVITTLFVAMCFGITWKLKHKELVFLFIIFVLTGCLLELAFTVYLKINRERASALLWGHTDDLGGHLVYKPHHYTLYSLREGYQNSKGTRHNQQGFRNEKDISIKKEKNQYRIFFIGGSTTYTIGIKDNRDIFTTKLEKILNRHARLHGMVTQFRVINAGMGGATSAENLSRLIYCIIQYQPDLIVIQHGLNDIGPRLRGRIQSDYANYRRIWRSTDEHYSSTLKNWIYKHILRKSDLLIFLCVRLKLLEPLTIRGVVANNQYEDKAQNLRTNAPEYFRRNTELMVLISKYAGSDVILASCPYNERVGETKMTEMPIHNGIMRDISGSMNVHFFDLYNVFNRSTKYLPDGLHVNQKGSDLKCKEYYQYLVHEYHLFEKLAH
jgi:lysophospholipase L1-like esterase